MLIIETQTKNRTRKYVSTNEGLFLLDGPQEEQGQIYFLHGGAIMGKDFNTAFDVNDDFPNQKPERLATEPNSLIKINLEEIARRPIGVSDSIIVSKYLLETKRVEESWFLPGRVSAIQEIKIEKD
ncbi:MAG: hypothetical protein AABW79_02820 [Nanoarchaeota archaeon]